MENFVKIWKGYQENKKKISRKNLDYFENFWKKCSENYLQILQQIWKFWVMYWKFSRNFENLIKLCNNFTKIRNMNKFWKKKKNS